MARHSVSRFLLVCAVTLPQTAWAACVADDVCPGLPPACTIDDDEVITQDNCVFDLTGVDVTIEGSIDASDHPWTLIADSLTIDRSAEILASGTLASTTFVVAGDYLQEGTLELAGLVTIDVGGSFTSTEDIDLDGGALIASSGGPMSVDRIDATSTSGPSGSIDLYSASDLTTNHWLQVDATLAPPGSISLTAAGSILIDSSIMADAPIGIDPGGTVTIVAGVDVTVDGSIDVTAGGTGGSVEITAADDIFVNRTIEAFGGIGQPAGSIALRTAGGVLLVDGWLNALASFMGVDGTITLEACAFENAGNNNIQAGIVDLTTRQSCLIDGYIRGTAGVDIHWQNSACVITGIVDPVPTETEEVLGPCCVDSDFDGACNDVDLCPGFDDSVDGDGDGVPDDCDLCPGDDNSDVDQDGVPDGCDPCPLDVLDDIDSDGVCDSDDPCPLDPLDDSDGDGSCDSVDICPGHDDGLDDDGDGVPDGCDLCAGSNDGLDADADTVPNGCDICPGSDDRFDADGDTAPDDCDLCPGFDDFEDADSDTVADGCDGCPGSDDLLDADSDTVPDGCDLCPGEDDLLDSDADGAPDGCDVCDGFDDGDDPDGDGVPSGCDPCPDDALDDSDGDGVCDGDDLCPGEDDATCDDGTDPDDPEATETDKGGCSCTTSGPSKWPMMPLLALGLVGLRRRRERDPALSARGA